MKVRRNAGRRAATEQDQNKNEQRSEACNEGREGPMCGRYEIVEGKRIFVRFGVANAAPEMLSNLDVRPTQQVLVCLRITNCS